MQQPLTPPALPVFQDLLAYTTWQRHEWHAWFTRQGATALECATGPHGDGRMPTVGALIRHIFSAELRYAERIEGRPLSDTASIPSTDVEALFELGGKSRGHLVALIDRLPATAWEAPFEFQVVGTLIQATPHKIVLHVLTHEIRHWAQVATLLRLQGMKGSLQDLLLSPVLGDSISL